VGLLEDWFGVARRFCSDVAVEHSGGLSIHVAGPAADRSTLFTPKLAVWGLGSGRGIACGILAISDRPQGFWFARVNRGSMRSSVACQRARTIPMCGRDRRGGLARRALRR